MKGIEIRFGIYIVGNKPGWEKGRSVTRGLCYFDGLDYRAVEQAQIDMNRLFQKPNKCRITHFELYKKTI